MDRLNRHIRYYLLLMGILCFNLADAQDPRFSQFTAGPLHLNPALTGVFEGQFRAALNYRTQWGSILADVPFNTFAASADFRYNLMKNDYLAVGLQAMHDRAGASQYTINRGGLSASILKQIAGGGRYSAVHYLVAGGQVGFGQNSLNWSDLWFTNQYDPNSESVNTSTNSGENTNDKSNIYLDFNAGLVWYAVLDENLSFHFGGAMMHISEPDISVLDGGEAPLHRRLVVHAGGELPLSDNISLMPGAYFSTQSESLETIFGTHLRYSNHDWREVALRIGAWGRMANELEDGLAFESVIVSAFLEMEQISLGLSYDINISSLSPASNSQGAFEISLIYKTEERRRFRVNCARF